MSFFPELDDPRRQELLGKIQGKLGTKKIAYEASVFLWLADLEKLEHFVSFDNDSLFYHLSHPPDPDVVGFWSGQTREAKEAMDAPSTAPSTGPSTPVKRSFSATEQGEAEATSHKRSTAVIRGCLKRDQNTCVITGWCNPTKACHIFPFRFGNSQCAKDELWSILRTFWTEEKVDSWMKVVLNDSGVVKTEQVRNLITLAFLHCYWDDCNFALKPLRKSPTTLTVEFWWLPMKFASALPKRVTPGTKPDLGNIANAPANGIKLNHFAINRPIESGDGFTLTTPDPVKYPLPSFELLEMQWNLHRIAALRGAADDDDESGADDDSSGDGGDVPVEGDVGAEDIWTTQLQEVTEEGDNIDNTIKGIVKNKSPS